jgi:hypothetical protein
MHDSGRGISGTLRILRHHGKPRLVAMQPHPGRQELESIVETIAEGKLGQDKSERDCIVQAFCRAAQAIGPHGELLLIEEINFGLTASRSGYRLRFGELRVAALGARALEIIDTRINQVIDRMLFGVISAHNVVPISGR